MFKNQVNIGGKFIGNGNPCFIVAEAGVSHLGSLDKAIFMLMITLFGSRLFKAIR